MAERAQPPRGGSSRGQSCGDGRRTGSPHGEAPGGGWGLLSPSLLLHGVGAGPGSPTGAFPKPRRHGRRVGTRPSQAAGAGTAFPRSAAPLRLCPPSLPRRQAAPPGRGDGYGYRSPLQPPGPEGTGTVPPVPPRGAGPQTSSPRSRRGFPCPVPHLQASWGRQQWDLWGYSGPQIRARSSPARFPSCPFRRERSTAAGGRDSPGPSPPSSPFPLQTPPSPGRGAIPLIQARSPKPAGAGG